MSIYHKKLIVILTFKKFQIKVRANTLHDSSRQLEAYSMWLSQQISQNHVTKFPFYTTVAPNQPT